MYCYTKLSTQSIYNLPYYVPHVPTSNLPFSLGLQFEHIDGDLATRILGLELGDVVTIVQVRVLGVVGAEEDATEAVQHDGLARRGVAVVVDVAGDAHVQDGVVGQLEGEDVVVRLCDAGEYR